VQNDFEYNSRSELTAAAMGTNRFDYAYDPIGNRLAATNDGTEWRYAANELNHYTNIEDGVAVQPAYDLDGNLTNDGAFACSWDGENRLIGVEPLDPVDGSRKVAFAHDHMGRRVQKQSFLRSGGSWSLTSDSWFLYDGWNLLAEYRREGAQASTNWFVWGLDLSGSMQGAGGIGGLLAMTKGSGEVLQPCYDANGNVTDLIDGTNGVAARYEYSPYGEVAAMSGYASTGNVFRFSTKFWDDEVGLLYYGRRFYSPSLGRWTSRDPIGEDGGWNTLGFVGNSPPNSTDGLGLCYLQIVRGSLPAEAEPGAGGFFKETYLPDLKTVEKSCGDGELGGLTYVTYCAATIWVLNPGSEGHERTHYRKLEELEKALQGLAIEFECQCDSACLRAQLTWLGSQRDLAFARYSLAQSTFDCDTNGQSDPKTKWCSQMIVDQARLRTAEEFLRAAMGLVERACGAR